MGDNSLPQRCELPGYVLHPGNLAQYLALVEHSVEQDTRETVFYQNLHSLYLYLTQPALRESFTNTTALVDGMPLIWLMRLSGYQALREQRVTWVDFIGPLMQLAHSHGWRVYHIGQSSDVQEQGLENLRAQYSGLQIEGSDGYFDQSPDSDDTNKLVARICHYRPHLLLVGLGTPVQEHWVAGVRDRLPVPAVLCCGACMEYVAGAVRTPPRWMGRTGLEWSFRLLENPRRFGHRYLIEPLGLALLLIRARWRAVRDNRPTAS